MEIAPFHIQLNTSTDDESEEPDQYGQKEDHNMVSPIHEASAVPPTAMVIPSIKVTPAPVPEKDESPKDNTQLIQQLYSTSLIDSDPPNYSMLRIEPGTGTSSAVVGMQTEHGHCDSAIAPLQFNSFSDQQLSSVSDTQQSSIMYDLFNLGYHIPIVTMPTNFQIPINTATGVNTACSGLMPEQNISVAPGNSELSIPQFQISQSEGYVDSVGSESIMSAPNDHNESRTRLPNDIMPYGVQSDATFSTTSMVENIQVLDPSLYIITFPTIILSSAGLLTVLLHNEVSVEMTLDRAIRVINKKHCSVAATNNRGTSSCIHHQAAKIFQDGPTIDCAAYGGQKAKISPEKLLFACNDSCFQLKHNGMQVAPQDFADLTKDMSVTILFSSSGYGPQLVPRYQEIITNATYRYHKDQALSIKINGIKIHQTAQGDVTVTSGPKYIRVSPNQGTTYVETHYLEMAIETNWNVRVRRGTNRISASLNGLLVSDGHRQCGFDRDQQVFIQPTLPKSHPNSYNQGWHRNPRWYHNPGVYSQYNAYGYNNQYHYQNPMHYGYNYLNYRPRTYDQSDRRNGMPRRGRPRNIPRTRSAIAGYPNATASGSVAEHTMESP